MQLFSLKFCDSLRCVLSVYILFFFIQCGKKTLPVPIAHFAPPPVENFEYSIDNTKLTLNWRFSVQNIPDTSVPKGFILQRSKLNVDEGDCEGCPPKFNVVAEIKIKESGIYEYFENLDQGFRYAFKVAPISDKGKIGSYSNTITFKF